MKHIFLIHFYDLQTSFTILEIDSHFLLLFKFSHQFNERRFIYYIEAQESQTAHLFLFSGGGGTDALILITSLTCLSNQSSCPTL